jgi:hypothetical protein
MYKSRYIIALVFSLFVINSAKSQNNPIPPKIELIFDTLYPSASNVYWDKKALSNGDLLVSFDCSGCKEGMHQKITFDNNGNIQNKDIYITEKDLPGNIVNYIENNYPNGFKYGNIIKNINNSGEMSYKVNMLQTNPAGDVTNGGWIYSFTFKASGEYVSMEKQLQEN